MKRLKLFKNVQILCFLTLHLTTLFILKPSDTINDDPMY